MKQPKVGVVVLNWNTYSETADCLRSLNNSTYENMFVVVVDNGSADESAQKLSNKFESPEFIFNDENLGFAGGANTGIEYALQEGAKYVLLLNNDIKVTPDFLGPLVETAERHSQVAAVGGLVYDGDGDIWYLGRKINPYLADITEDSDAKMDEEFETEFVTCAYSLLTRDFLEDHMLDENYFFGVEEIDLSWQAKKDNWKLFVNPKSEVYHYDAASTDYLYEGDNLFSSFQKYHNTRGRLYFSSKNTTLLQSSVYFLLSLTIFPIFYIWLGIMHDRWDIIYAHSLAIYDHFQGKPPKKPSYFE